MLTYYQLQQYWWIIISLLGALLVFLMFVQGGQTLFGKIASNEAQKTLMINSLGRKWEFTFTTLVTFGGAMFAAFPKFYSTSFGGAYWVWMIILFCFIIQAVSYEFRKKAGNFLGAKTYEAFLYINGSVGVILIGIAVGTFFNGGAFFVDENNFSYWAYGSRGLEAALDPHNVALGLSVFFLARILALLYFINDIDNKEIYVESVARLKRNTLIFLPFFLYFVIFLLIKSGYAIDPQSGLVYFEKYKYLNNFLEMPLVLVIFVAGVLLVLFGIFKGAFGKSKSGIWFSGIGTVLTVFALLLIAGLNNTSFYPSNADIQSSLTIRNSSSSEYTLTAMSYVSLMVPFVFAYIWYAWRAISRKPITLEEIQDKDEHTY
ncbi:MAG: cytochrome d ubiquinol oxidase subunit II [Bacteroidetes bacterium]|nr:cytochrome d ubiquinol oxidase subunit II [Bacteroidota bacterium]